MADSQADIIENNPIGTGLDAFRASFSSICQRYSVSAVPDAVDQFDNDDLEDTALDLLLAFQVSPASRLLRSSGRGKNLFNDLSRLNSTVGSDDFDINRLKPLLRAVLNNEDDEILWKEVYHATVESTPPPRPIASALQQTPWLRNTSSFVNSSEHRKYVDGVLKEELGTMHVGLREFQDTYFGGISDLATASDAAFKKCMEGDDPLYQNSWRGWPVDAKEDGVLSWISELSEKLAAFAEDIISTPISRRRPLAQPNRPIPGSVSERKLDVGFVKDSSATKDSRCHWSQILVPGELKSNPSADIPSKAWLDLGTYAREVLAAQDNRRFVLGFTLCGSLMRLWVFDRLGGIASEQFDVNKDGLRFVSTILGFLSMSEEQLGFDPTIVTANGQRFIEIKRNDSTERLIIEGVMLRARCIAGRATTCWKAHREGHPQKPLVIKDSWQYTERDEEGELLRDATDKGVINIARYYYHETVQVHDTDDDIRGNVRGGLDVTKATNYRSEPASVASRMRQGQGRSSSTATSKKRSSSQTDATLPPNKRRNSASPSKTTSNVIRNRIHRRVILSDYGTPIYKASSRAALLSALEGCIKGHESLYKAGFLHRDISINNLMINEDNDNPSWSSFLIDLDLAIREPREGASGAKGKTGTRAFMAIGALLGEQHSFMHDLESFFWVLFWICIHYDAEGKDIGPTGFDNWNSENDDKLISSKIGEIADEEVFLRKADQNFTPHYQPLVPTVNRLRRKVFPNGKRWKTLEPGLYSSMQEILRDDARKDLEASEINSVV
ncbi:hypothetical protein ACQKWADRAFT_281902 [Trichoderma austrokoningii]